MCDLVCSRGCDSAHCNMWKLSNSFRFKALSNLAKVIQELSGRSGTRTLIRGQDAWEFPQGGGELTDQISSSIAAQIPPLDQRGKYPKPMEERGASSQESLVSAPALENEI